MQRFPGRILLIVAAFALLLVPVAAFSANGDRFDDVGDGNIFKADIEWLATTGVTKGCNPPTNTKFCPDDPVTRGQMAAFIHRLAKGVVHAKTADEATTAFWAQSALFADDATYAEGAGTLNGKTAADLTSDAFSVYHDAMTGIGASMTTVLELEDLPAGAYVFIGKTNLFHPLATPSVECTLVAGVDHDTIKLKLDSDQFHPVTLTVVTSFPSEGNKAALRCKSNANGTVSSDTKVTGISVDNLRNTPG